MIVIIAAIVSILALFYVKKIQNRTIKWLLSFLCCILPVVCSFVLQISKQESYDYSIIFPFLFVYFFVKIIHNLLYIFILDQKEGIVNYVVGWSGIIFYILGITFSMKLVEEPYFVWIVIFTGILFIIEFLSTFHKNKEIVSS